MSSFPLRALAVAAFSMAALSCADSPTGPLRDMPVASIRLSDTLFTRSAIIRAGVDVPAGYALRPGSVRWTIASGAAAIGTVAGTSDSVDITLTTAGTVAVRAAYTLTSAGAGSTISLGTPSRRVPGDVTVETERSITVASPRLEYGVLPSGLVVAGAPLGGVRVDIRDASGRLMTNATDSITITLDPTSGTPGAVLLGTAAARAVGGSASFPGLSIRRSGSAYRLVASSPTISVRDTATTFVVAGAPSAATSSVAVIDSVRAVGQTTTVTVTLRDEFGNPVTSGTSSAFVGTPTLGTLGGFTCVSGVCTATYTATTVGSGTVGVTIGGVAIGGSPAPIRVTAGPAARLVITGVNAQTAGSSQLITITAFDAFGNIATSYTGAKLLTFSGAAAAPSGTTFPTIGTTNFGTGTSITFVNGVATGVAMTLVKVETAPVATTDGTISAAGADRLFVTVTAAAASASTGGGASGVTSSITVSRDTLEVADSLTVTVRLFDAFGNPILTAAPTDFSTAISGGTLRSFTCVAGVCTAQWIAPTTPGPRTIGATIGGAAVSGSPATVEVVAGAADPTTSTITVVDSVLTQGGTTIVRITLRDRFGNPVTTGTPSVSATTTIGTLGTFSCVNGVCSATYTGTTPGTSTITGSIGGTSMPTTTAVRVNSGVAAKLIITGAGTQVAGTTQNITITAFDAFGNVATSYTGAKLLTFSGAAAAPSGTTFPTIGTTNFGTGTSITFVNGVATGVAMTLVKVETAPVATTDGTISAAGADRLFVTVTAAAPSASTGGGSASVTSSIEVSRDTLEVADSLTVTVRLFDAFGNPVLTAAPTDFSTAISGGTLRSFTCAAGVCTAQWIAPTTPGPRTIGATIGGAAVSGSPATVEVVAGAADPTTSTITVVDSVLTQGGTTIVRITLRDRFGNPVTTGTPPSVSATTTRGTVGAFTCVNGVCSATYTGTTLGVATITGSIGGTSMPTTTTVRVTVGPAAKLVITGSPTAVAGVGTIINIVARDAFGNVATGYTGAKLLTFSGAAVAPNGITLPTVTTINFGTATSITFNNGIASSVPMTLFAAETAVIAATDGSIAATGADRHTIVVEPNNASPVVSDLQASPASITADGVATSVLTLQLKDAHGNPTPRVLSPGIVVIERTAGTGTLVADFTSIGGGSYTQTVTSAAVAGSGTFKVRLNGTLGTQQAVVTYVAAGGPLSRLVCTLSQAAAQSAASNTTVALCGATAVGDLELVTLALDGDDDIVAPTAPADGNWVKISSTVQSSGSGGNKPMLLVIYARRYAAGNSRSVTFTAATQHKWSVDMVTFVSSGLSVPSGGDIIVSQNTSGAGLTTPGLTAADDNTVLYYVMGNSLTGNIATPTPDGLTLLANNNTGGTSSASYMELLPTTGDVAPARTWSNTKTANTVLVQLLVRP